MAAYRSTSHTTTGETPNRLMLGREVTTPLQLLAPVPPNTENRHAWVETLHENFAEAHVRVQEQIGRAQRSQKQCHDKRQKKFEFVEGQKVWLLEARPKKGTPYKLNPWRWRGPYEIRKRISAAVYVVAFPEGRNTWVVNADRLKPCIERQVERGEIEGEQHDMTDANIITENEEAEDAPENNLQRINERSEAVRRPQRTTRRPAGWQNFEWE
jgi:polyhydroxyalkanoate synthesis regulator phasin